MGLYHESMGDAAAKWVQPGSPVFTQLVAGFAPEGRIGPLCPSANAGASEK